MEMDYKQLEGMAEILKALAHPVRLCIAKGLLERGECNVTHMQNRLEMPQSTVSQHIQKLRAAGIIEGERSGLEINYKIKDERIRRILSSIIENIE